MLTGSDSRRYSHSRMYHIWYTDVVRAPEKIIIARFYRLISGREPVREWLGKLPAEDRRLIGRDLMKAEFSWPCGPPLCISLTGYPGLHEVRSNLTGRRIARVFFIVSRRNMVLLHAFIKKTQATPVKELKLAERRMKEYGRYG